MTDDRAGKATSGKHDTTAALTMLDLFASIGATTFDVTLTDLAGKKVAYHPNRSLTELKQTIGFRLEAATRHQTNVILRPRSKTATLIQLDDLDPAAVARITPLAFMVLRTSPGNFQAWIAVEKEVAPDFALRLKRGTGADPTASGATRIAGSLNFKEKYAPAFPCVAITHAVAVHRSSCSQLENAGCVAPREEQPPEPPASVPRRTGPPVQAPNRKWPDYQRTLCGAPLKPDGTPDRSRADFMFCKWAIERGWSTEDTAVQLAAVSQKAQERIRIKEDEGYPLVTARKAAEAVERERARRQPFNPSSLRPAR